MRILDLGCGYGHLTGPGVVKVDLDPRIPPDVLCDLNRPLPFREGVFDHIHCAQVLEHLEDLVGIMQEIHRVAKPNATVAIGVPHYSSKIAVVDPTHRRFFSTHTMRYFEEDYFYAPRPFRFRVEACRLKFSKFYAIFLVPWWANLLQRFYEDHLAGIFPAKYIEWTLRVIKV